MDKGANLEIAQRTAMGGFVARLYGIILWLPQIVKSFGYGNTAVGFITAIPFLGAVIAQILWTRHSDRTGERLGHVVGACLVASLGLGASAWLGYPYDGHTLGPIIADLQKLTGVEAQRIHVDKGYRGHTYPNRFRVWISGQVRRVTKTIRREMKRRAAVEPVIVTSRPNTAWAATTSRAAPATESTPSSPPPASTSTCCCAGSNGFCGP
jgi:hypothetical protein